MRPLRIGLALATGILAPSMLLGVLRTAGASEPPMSPPPAAPFYATGKLLVRFDPDVTAQDQQRAVAAIGGREEGRIVALDTIIVAVDDVTLSANRLMASGDVVWAEPDHMARIQDAPLAHRGFRLFVPAAMVSNDPRAADQWHHTLIRTGEAWQISRGAGVTIAVVDTGVDCELLELAYQCVAGYDFVNDDSDATDDHGHGTDVASIAAGAANNGVGGIGVAPEARVMPLKAMGDNGFGSYAAIANSVVWATDLGADVINLSLGGYYDSATLRAAVAYAVDRGLVVVSAAGNDSLALPTYPAAYPGVIAVAATDRLDGHWQPSNQGAYVDLAAPGAGVATTTLHGWGVRSGTSEATPIVAGVAALLRSRDGGLDSEDVLARISAGAVDLGEPGWDPLFGYGRVDAAGAVLP